VTSSDILSVLTLCTVDVQVFEGGLFGDDEVLSVCPKCFFTTHCSLRLTVRSELDVPTFATRRLHACHHARTPSGGRWNCGREMSGSFA